MAHDTSQRITATQAKLSLPRRCMPTFLGVGSMRCGSTWLYEVLKCHPDIRLSDHKEMDFFFMHQMLRNNFDWYEAQFAPEAGGKPKLVRGEISPLYARLKGWQVRRIAEALPNLRIILILRNPIERVWSQALLELGHHRGRDIRKIGAVEFLRQIERPRNLLSSDYPRTIEVWSKAFGRAALHIDLFDRLRDDPQGFVNGVLRHIGATTPWVLPEKFKANKVFSANSLVEHERQIPEVVQWYIADRFLEPTERLNEFLNGRITKWVGEMRTIRGKRRLSWRILAGVNRAVLSIPERLAYEGYHVLVDVRLWFRWCQLQRSFVPTPELEGSKPVPSQVDII